MQELSNSKCSHSNDRQTDKATAERLDCSDGREGARDVRDK